jgi:hypothetical protein
MSNESNAKSWCDEDSDCLHLKAIETNLLDRDDSASLVVRLPQLLVSNSGPYIHRVVSISTLFTMRSFLGIIISRLFLHHRLYLD